MYTEYVKLHRSIQFDAVVDARDNPPLSCLSCCFDRYNPRNPKVTGKEALPRNGTRPILSRTDGRELTRDEACNQLEGEFS